MAKGVKSTRRKRAEEHAGRLGIGKPIPPGFRGRHNIYTGRTAPEMTAEERRTYPERLKKAQANMPPFEDQLRIARGHGSVGSTKAYREGYQKINWGKKKKEK